MNRILEKTENSNEEAFKKLGKFQQYCSVKSNWRRGLDFNNGERRNLEAEAEEVLEEEDVATISIKEEVKILDHLAKEEVDIILNLLIEEEEEVTITKKKLILIVFIVGSLDTKL